MADSPFLMEEAGMQRALVQAVDLVLVVPLLVAAPFLAPGRWQLLVMRAASTRPTRPPPEIRTSLRRSSVMVSP